MTAALLLATALFAAPATGERKPADGLSHESDELVVLLRPRTPEQIAAFYEARGFPADAIALVRETCFVTVHIENRGQRVIWLDTAEWSLDSEGKPVSRIGRDEWEATWARINLRQASRSTFGWTQLPALRDLQPGEPVGGNIVLPGDILKFDMRIHMPTGADRGGEPVEILFRDVPCPSEAAPQ